MHENVKKILLLRGDFVPCNTGYLSNAVAHTYSSIHYKCTTTFVQGCLILLQCLRMTTLRADVMHHRRTTNTKRTLGKC